MNILKIQDDLKNFSQQQLVTEMQRPSGNVPQFLVLSELSRRKRMQTDQARAEAANTPTVAQEAVAAAGMPMGGVTQMAQAMAPKTSMTENTGIAAMMPKQPTRMVEGGVVKMQAAGQPEDALEKLNKQALAELKRLYPEVYEQYKDNPRELLYIARQMLEVAKEPELRGLEQAEKPRTPFQSFMDFAKYSPLKAKKNMKKIEEGNKEREIAGQIATRSALSKYFGDTDTKIPTMFDDPIFAEGAPVETLKGTAVPVALPSSLRDKITTELPINRSGPSVMQDLPINASNFTQAEDPYVGNRLGISESVRLSPSFLKPNVPQVPDQSGIEEDMAQDAIRKALADPSAVGATDLLDQTNFTDDDSFLATSPEAAQSLRNAILNPDFEGTPHPRSRGLGSILSGNNMGDVNRRALEYYNTDTYTPPEMIYSGDVRDILKREEASPEEIQAASDRLYNEAIEGEEAKIKQQFGDADAEAQAQMDAAIAAQAAMVEKEGEPKTLFDRMASFIPTDLEAATYLESKFDELTTKAADFLNRDTVKEETSDLDKERQEEAEQQANNILDQLKLNSEKTSAAASKADLSLSEYVKGLDEDRESSKWLAVARMGAELMKPSATIGEGIGKAVSVGAKDLQQGKKAYNKNKLTVLGLQARIDAAKAKSGALTTNQRLTQGLKFQEEARKLEEAARMTNPPDLNMLEQARAFNITAQQLLGMPSMAQSNVVKAPSAT